MAEWLVIGGLIWWVVIAVYFVALWASVSNNSGIYSSLFTVGFLTLLQCAFGVDIIHHFMPPYSWNGFFHGVAWVVGWGLMGSVIAILFWSAFVDKATELYFQMRNDWLKSKGRTCSDDEALPEDLKEEWVKFVEIGYGERRRVCSTVQAKDHKAQILLWIGWWPIYGLDWIFNDMVKSFCKLIFNNIVGYLQEIANRKFRKVRRDLPEDFKYVN